MNTSTFLSAVAMVLLASCGGGSQPADGGGEPPPASQPLPYTVLDGPRSRIQVEARSVITDVPHWIDYWGRHSDPGSPWLPVDFSQRMVAAMTLGARPDGCWGVSPVAVEEWPDRIAVRYRETMSTGTCTAEVVYPALLLAIPRSGKPVQWVATATSEPGPGDRVFWPYVQASYDPPQTGACRLLRLTATLPAGPQAAASDLTVSGLALIDASGNTQAATWDSVQVSVDAGLYRVSASGCPGAAAPHATVWPLLTFRLYGVEHELFAVAITLTDTASLPFHPIASSTTAAIATPHAFLIANETAFADFWTQ